jgi:alpha-glucosidase
MLQNFKKILSLLFISSIVWSPVAFSQGTKKQAGTFVFSNASSSLKIEFCSPSMFRVRRSWKKEMEPDEALMVINYRWPPVKVNSSEQKGTTILSTSDLTLIVYKNTLQLDVRDHKGGVLSSESFENGGSFNRGDSVGVVKKLSPDEHFFGFGERMDFLDRRSKQLRLDVGRGKGLPHIIGAYNILEANYCPVPFFMSTKGYGIFFHTAYPNFWDMGHGDAASYKFGATGGTLDYYFIYGPKFPSILNAYTSLTGRSPLMPLFAYGLHMGTYSGGAWGYEELTSDHYVVALAKMLRSMGIPVDILWLDSTWRIFGEVGGKGATSFEWRETFKNPRMMFDSLYAMNFKMVGLHLRPRFDNGKKIKLLDTAQRLGFTYPEENSPGEFVNFFDSASVDFWWKHGVMRVASIGAKFLKTDEGSAFGAPANESDKIGPQGKGIDRLHNLFPLAYAKAPYEKFQQYNHMRGLNQTREGYAGIQRYPYLFAGDWPSEWQYFAPVIKAGINIGLSGVGHWAHCMGGFEHAADPELYIRWVQFGMFSPIAMVFGMDHPGYKEPWNYGEDALRNFRRYDSLRYRMMPYLYSTAHQMYQTGLPIMRALVIGHQEDENVYEIGDQYMLGDNLMVCPVTTKGAQTRTVYLPKGEWFDYWTGRKITGAQYIHVVTPLDTIPLFAKAGAIIPMQPAMKYTGEKPVDTIELDIFPGNGSYDLYEDDGVSLDYQQGIFSITRMRSKEESSSLQIAIDKPEGKFTPAGHGYKLRVHVGQQPARVVENGVELSDWRYDEEQKILFVAIKGNNRSNIVVRVEYRPQ